MAEQGIFKKPSEINLYRVVPASFAAQREYLGKNRFRVIDGTILGISERSTAQLRRRGNTTREILDKLHSNNSNRQKAY